MGQLFSTENMQLPSSSSIPLPDESLDILTPAKKIVRPQFLLRETPMVFDASREIIRASDGLGWSNMAAVLARTDPFEEVVPPISSLFIAVPQQKIKIVLEKDGKTFQGEMAANSHNIIAPGNGYAVQGFDLINAFYVYIKNEILRELADEIYGRRLDEIDLLAPTETADPSLTYLLDTCKHMLSEPAGTNLSSDYLAQAIVACVFSRHSQLRDVPRSADSKVPLSQAQMQRVNDYLQANLDGSFQVADLAAVIGLSRTIFFERFTVTTKATPNQYLQVLRINRAKQLLRDGKLSLVDIAFACGYADQSHLARFFKRFVGVAPGRYRKDAH
ncbi:transcriptional regulator, AraC family [Janthinobacterium sp. Marseille]|nr:transcriptional regulator, AraC family [Janthinobacterium sp. Marseille]